MASQDQHIHDSQIEDSDVQVSQAGRDAISFQNSDANRVTINNVILRLFDWDWAKQLLEKKRLEQQVLLSLLDGLDELGLERQQKCMVKLNQFTKQYS